MRTNVLRNENLQTTTVIFLAVLVSVMLISTRVYENEDVEYKWAAVAAWAHGDFPAYEFNHHNLRWGMNGIGVVWVALFGESPISYLTLNYVVFSVSTAGMYWLARSMFSRGEAMIVMAIWLLNPVLYRLPSNFMPELYGQFYLILALVLMRLAYIRNSRALYACSMMALFCLYGAKETNVFFMPGLALWELMRRRFDNLAIMVGVFVVGLGIETAIVNWAGQSQSLVLGRLEALAHGKHVKEMEAIFPATPADILGRWSLHAAKYIERNEMWNSELPSKLLYLLFFVLAPALAVLGWRRARARSGAPAAGGAISSLRAIDPFAFAVIAMGLSFAFCTTFFILSLDPFITGQPLVDRYLWILLTPVLLTIGAAIVVLRQWLDVRPGWLQGKLAKAGSGLSAVFGWIDRRAMLVFAIVMVASTGLRFYVDGKIVERRNNAEQPYAYFDANAFFKRSIRSPLEAGCTLVFVTPKASWSAMIFGFPYGTFTDPAQLYAEKLDGLKTYDGATLRTWPVTTSEMPGLEGRMHVKGADLTAVRLESAAKCDRVYYLGHLDIPADQQIVEGEVGDTAPAQP